MPRLPALLLIAALAPSPLWAQDAPSEVAPEVALEPAPEPATEAQPEAAEEPAPPAPPAEPAPADLSELGPAALSVKLNDADYAVRDAAMGLLLIDTSLDEQVLAELLAQATTPEQRQRLLAVAEHHIIRGVLEQIEVPVAPDGAGISSRDVRNGTLAAIGFSHSPITQGNHPYADTAGVLVSSTMPGFPGYAYLRPGDLILAINGQTCPENDDARILEWVSDTVTAHPAGARMTLAIVRGGKECEVVFGAVNVYALGKMYKTHLGQSDRKPAYDRQWQEARARLTADLPGPSPLAPAED